MRKRNILSISIFFFLMTQVLACDGGKMETKPIHLGSLKDVSLESWENLSKKKIYFGHQSVGINLIDGINDLIKENPNIKLNIVETTDIFGSTDGIFAHSKVGKNMDPTSKINDFKKVLKDGVGNSGDIVAIKFCYVDVASKTDVNHLLKNYTEAIDTIKKSNPNIQIVHFTVPLQTVKTTWKTKIKEILGKEAWEYQANIKRNEYNKLLLERYKGKEPVFDLAEIEATHSDGKQCTFTNGGKLYYCMVPDYTYDGGHLNEVGRKWVAEHLLIALAELQ